MIDYIGKYENQRFRRFAIAPMIMFTAHRNIPMGSPVPEALN